MTLLKIASIIWSHSHSFFKNCPFKKQALISSMMSKTIVSVAAPQQQVTTQKCKATIFETTMLRWDHPRCMPRPRGALLRPTRCRLRPMGRRPCRSSKGLLLTVSPQQTHRHVVCWRSGWRDWRIALSWRGTMKKNNSLSCSYLLYLEEYGQISEVSLENATDYE